MELGESLGLLCEMLIAIQSGARSFACGTSNHG